jgi:hypothetical protein
MKRKALLIGNTNGLAGVQIDIQKTKAFLLSNVGGAWLDSEIDVITNPRRVDLLAHLNRVRQSSPDYVFTLFSGHGGLEKRTTILELNDAGETVAEDVLFKIAPRQISVFDCCRATSVEPLMKSYAADSITESYKAIGVRERFDAQIMKAIPQQVLLYACSMGQVSNDTASGGIYLQNLLYAAKSLKSGAVFKTAERAHSEAAVATTATKNVQTPEAILPKCLSSQQLVLSVLP